MSTKNILMNRLNCDENEATSIENDLAEISPALKDILENWILDETIDDSVTVCGYTITKLMDLYDMKFTGAILTLDWIIKDPEEATKALKYGIR